MENPYFDTFSARRLNMLHISGKFACCDLRIVLVVYDVSLQGARNRRDFLIVNGALKLRLGTIRVNYQC